MDSWKLFVEAISGDVKISFNGDQVKRIHNNKGNVPYELYDRMIAFCSEKKISFADAATSEGPQILTDDESDPGWAGFLKTLALTSGNGQETAERFAGRYLYGLLDENNTVAVLNCH